VVQCLGNLKNKYYPQISKSQFQTASPHSDTCKNQLLDRKRLKNKLYRYRIIHSYYSITEFLECKINKEYIKYKTTFMTTFVINAFILIVLIL